MAPHKRRFSLYFTIQNEVAKWGDYVSTWVNLDWRTKLAVGCQEEGACWAWNKVHTSYCLTIIILGAALWASHCSLAGLFPRQSTYFFFFALFPGERDNGTTCLWAVNINTSSKSDGGAFFCCIRSEQCTGLRFLSIIRSRITWPGVPFFVLQSHVLVIHSNSSNQLYSWLVTRLRSSSKNTTCILIGHRWWRFGSCCFTFMTTHIVSYNPRRQCFTPNGWSH